MISQDIHSSLDRCPERAMEIGASQIEPEGLMGKDFVGIHVYGKL
jgi:hypothetical protein